MTTGETKFRQDMPTGVNAYSFDEFRLDLSRGALMRDGRQVPLRPKAFDVLHCLVCHQGELLSRDVLLEWIWPNLVVSDDSLTQCVIEIRKALGDQDRNIIRTIPRRGYRFEAAVEIHGTPESEGFSGSAKSAAARAGRLPSLWTLAGLFLIVIAVAVTWWRTGDHATTGEHPFDVHPLPTSIAVLPFVDMSESGDQQYLAEGIAEEILNSLAQSPELTVIARTSSFSFKEANQDINSIAARLNVTYILEGSVRLLGERVRVTTQLVDGKTGAHLWSETYDDLIRDTFALQDRIARRVASVLKIKLAAQANEIPGMTSHVPDPRAWEVYRRGQLLYSRRNGDDILRAQQNFEKAIQIDPRYADPWVSLAAALRVRQTDPNVPDELRLSRNDANSRRRDALENALALRPNHPEALWRYSWLTSSDHEIDKTLEQLSSAIQFGRNNAMVQSLAAGSAFSSGHLELAIPFSRRAITLDPIAATHRESYGYTLYLLRRFDEAERAFRQAVELAPHWSEKVHRMVTWIRIHREDIEGAAQSAPEMPIGPDRDLAFAILGHLQNNRRSSDAALQQLLSHPSDKVSGRLAFAYAARGNNDEAFKWLYRATELYELSESPRSTRGWFNAFIYSPFLSSLHDDPRWAEWFSRANHLFLNKFDYRVVEILQGHLESHQELYAGFPDEQIRN
jgi:TolB-like protein/DNA-binding winged helix-turn-helix (wHTH) protein/Flp pilus assembly protein TadD